MKRKEKNLHTFVTMTVTLKDAKELNDLFTDLDRDAHTAFYRRIRYCSQEAMKDVL